jgi:hypothetical protein
MIGAPLQGFSGLGPGGWGERFQFGSLGFGQPLKNIAQVFGGVDAVPPATAEHRVDHRAALAGFGMPDEQKILFSMPSSA